MAYPVYETVVACGFFFIALIEQLAHRCLKQAAKIEPEMVDNNNTHANDLEVGHFFVVFRSQLYYGTVDKVEPTDKLVHSSHKSVYIANNGNIALPE